MKPEIKSELQPIFKKILTSPKTWMRVTCEDIIDANISKHTANLLQNLPYLYLKI